MSLPSKIYGDASRALRFESLENRRLLAVFTVSQLSDSPVAMAGAAPGTLRQALFDANSAAGADIIDFQVGLSGTITLSAGELVITDDLSVVGPGAAQLTVDATGNDVISPGTADGSGSRVMNIDDGDAFVEISVEISGLTLTGGDVSGNGGGIRSIELLSLSQVKLVDNSASGETARGGGIFNFGGGLSIDLSTLSGNLASGASADGGGVFSESKVNGVQTTSITNSTLSDNQASRNGGGIHTSNNISQDQKTVIVNSTISGNTASNAGGGIYNFDGTTSLKYTTVTNNSAASEAGGGVASYGDGDLSTTTNVHSSIISGNNGGDLAVLAGEENSIQSTGFNVVGTGNSFGALNQFSALDNFTATGDQTNILDPGLETLASNGGLTFTHALKSTSVALDAGDPAAQANIGDVPEFDQRLAPFGRVRDGDGNGAAIIDIGAFEVVSDSADSDFDSDGDVDGIDFLSWQRGFGIAQAAQREDGDADGDGAVDDADLAIWMATYGLPTPLQVAGTISYSPVLASISQNSPSQLALPPVVATSQITSDRWAVTTNGTVFRESFAPMSAMQTSLYGPSLYGPSLNGHSDLVHGNAAISVPRAGRANQQARERDDPTDLAAVDSVFQGLGIL